MKTTILIILILAMLFASMGCISTSVNAHNKYTQVTIVDKFFNTQITNPFVPLYSYNYFIRYSTNGDIGVNRVSKDVYAGVFENNTYVLLSGYIEDIDCINKEFGYISVVSKV